MGSVFSRAKPTTVEILENLEQQITELEERARNTHVQQRHFLGYLAITSVLAYVCCAAYAYFNWSPKQDPESLLIAGFFVVFPIAIWSLRYLVRWIYDVKLENNGQKLISLRQQKRKILDNVKNTETYKVALEILERFDKSPNRQDQIVSSHQGADISPNESVRRRTNVGQVTPRNVRRTFETPRPARPVPQLYTQSPRLLPTPRPHVAPPPPPPSARRGEPSSQVPKIDVPPDPPCKISPRPSPTLPNGTTDEPRVLPTPVFTPTVLPRPIPQAERGPVDKLVDYLVGDGPNNRNALICSHCHGHNGMALQEEFEYLAFRCCYCYAFNPARKQKLRAPSMHDISSLEESPHPKLHRESSADPVLQTTPEIADNHRGAGVEQDRVTLRSTDIEQDLSRGYEALAHMDEAVAATTATLLSSAEAAVNCSAMESAPGTDDESQGEAADPPEQTAEGSSGGSTPVDELEMSSHPLEPEKLDDEVDIK